MDPLKVAHRRSIPGVIVFNHQQEPIFWNKVAHALLSRSNVGKPHSNGGTTSITIPKEISNLFNKLKRRLQSPLSGPYAQAAPEVALLSRGDTNYCCLGFFLHDQTRSSSKTFCITILIEKISEHRNIDLDRLKNRFKLTEKQIMMLKLLVSGLSNKEMAHRLCVCEDTIKGHMKHVMRRLGVNSRTEILSMMFEQ